VNVSYPTPTYMSGAQPKTMTEIMLFSDRLHHAIAVSGGRVFAIEGDLDTATARKKAADAAVPQRAFGGQLTTAGSRQNEIACYDVKSGRFLWAAGRATGLPDGAAVCSRPLVVGSQLFVALGIDNQLGLAALDVATGKLTWKTTLADLGRAVSTTPVGIMVDDGSIYVASGAGKVFSVDRNGGALRWAASYPRMKSVAPSAVPRFADGTTGERVQVVLDENFVAREDDMLIVAACDSDHLMAFNVTDGSLRWDSPLPQPALSGSLGYVVGIGNGRIHLANNKWLWTVMAKGGRIAWEASLDGSCGRGLLAGDSLYLPQSSRILRIDPGRGSVLSRTEVATPDSEPVGNLVGDGDQILVASAARLLAFKPGMNETSPPPEEKKTPEGSER
jgi:outer membrane protein assembly factor BamB